MSTQAATIRRAAALAAAANLGPMRDDVAVAIEQKKALYAAKRAQREPQNKRKDERRAGPFDRREHETFDRRSEDRRQFATMADKLAAEAKKQGERQYEPEPSAPSAFMDAVR